MKSDWHPGRVSHLYRENYDGIFKKDEEDASQRVDSENREKGKCNDN